MDTRRQSGNGKGITTVDTAEIIAEALLLPLPRSITIWGGG
jgi:hypothetical protein